MIQNIQNYILSAKKSKSNITVFDFDKQACNLLTTEAIHNSINNTQETIYHKLQDGGFQTNLTPVEYKKQIELAKNGNYGFRIINVHYNSDIIKSITASLSIQNNCNSACNLYFTPKGVKALRKHSDNYDIFIVQLAGSKRWFLDDFEILIKQGDGLYIPKGQMHEAISKEDSTHLAFSIPRFTYGDLVDKSLELQNFKTAMDISSSDENLKIIFDSNFKSFTEKNIQRIYDLYFSQVLLARNSIPFYGKTQFKPDSPIILNFPKVTKTKETKDLIQIHTTNNCFEFNHPLEIEVLNEICNLKLKNYPVDNIKKLSFLKFLYNKELIRNLVL